MVVSEKICHESMDFMKWSIQDLAWAAGFIDGDGMISCYLRSDRKSDIFIKVGATNTNMDPLRKLQTMFGGSICVMHRASTEKNWKQSWSWSVTHKRAERVLLAISSHLVAKHEQATKALLARSYVSSGGSRRSPETLEKLHSIVASFREINRKGFKSWATSPR